MLYAFAIFAGWMIIFIIVFKFYLDKSSGRNMLWSDYFSDFVCYGSSKIFVDTIELSHGLADKAIVLNLLKTWFAFSIKYFMPFCLWHIIVLFDATGASSHGHVTKTEVEAEEEPERLNSRKFTQ